MTAPPISAPQLTRRKHYEAVRLTLETERTSFINLWKTLNNFILPVRARFATTDGNRGDRRSKDIIDETATLAARTLMSGMMSGITHPARPWFRLTTPDPDMAEHRSIKEWLFTSTERMRYLLTRTNFYNRMPMVYRDLGVYGTAGVVLLEDDKHFGRFLDMPVGSYSVANGPYDEPTIMTRSFRMTVRQLVKAFGINRCSNAVQSNWRSGNTEAWYDVGHIVMENDQHDPERPGSMPWQSCYYEIGATHPNVEFLQERGFEEMPLFVPVWEASGEDVYGTDCPGITALSGIRQLQVMEKRGLQGLEKMVNPPMTGPTALRSVRATILPGDITYVDTREGQQGFRPAHEVNLALDKLEAKMAARRAIIDEAFFKPLFLMLTYMDANAGRQPKTATEIMERHEEKLLALGPVLETMNVRFFDPMIHRFFGMMKRRGFLPPPPPDLQGMDLKIEYISMMHQAQKASNLGGYRGLVSDFLLPIASVDPSVMDKVDTDKLIERVNESSGNPPDLVRSQEEVDQIRQARAQAQAAQREEESLQRRGDAAKNLAQADTSGKNALTDMLQSMEDQAV